MPSLAIDGGHPVRQSMLPYGHQVITDSDIEAVIGVLRSDYLTTGNTVSNFESSIAHYCGARYGVAVSNGTAALHAALYACGIDSTAEVIVPAMTFAATANAARYLGARVKFSDARDDTLTINHEDVERLITARTRAIVAVDFAGHPAHTLDLEQIAKQKDLFLIYDAAHSLGAEIYGKRVGSFGHATTFSFHPVKHITTGEGGMVVTDHPNLSHRAKIFRSHGIDTTPQEREASGEWFYKMIDLGYNYRLTDIQCALGLSQLSRHEAGLKRRRDIAETYNRAFEYNGLLEIPAVDRGVNSAWHLYVIRLNLNRLNCTRREFFVAMRAENIGVNVHYIPVYWHPYYARLGYERGLCPVAEREYERMMTLPLWHGMTNADVADVIEAVNKVSEHYRF